MSPMWSGSGKSAPVEAAMKNMLAAATQQILDQWDPYDEEDEERKERSQVELDELDRAGDPSPEGSPPPKGRTSKHKADKKAAKELHERVIYYRTESDRKQRLNRRNNNGFAHAGTVDRYMQGHHIRQIDAPPHSPTEDSQNPHHHHHHHHPPQPQPRRRGFSFGGLFKSNKKKPLSPPSPVLPHHEGSLDSYEERHIRQGPMSPPQDIHHSQYNQEPASPSKLLKRHGSTSSRTRGHDDYPPPQMKNKISSRDGGDYADRPHRSSSHRQRDRDRDGYRDKDRDRDRGMDPSRSRRHDKSYSYEDRRYPPSSRRDLGGSDKYGSSRHREGSRDRERSSKHRDDDYRHGSSSNRHRSSRKKHYSDDDDEDSEERRRRRRERREREKDRDRDRRRHDDLPEKPPSVHDQASVREEGHHGGDAGGDFHDAASVHDSEHKPRDDHDALSVSDHLSGGLHVSG